MKKVHLGVIIAGAAVGLAALILTALGNPTNMGFCIACFLRDISGAVGLHSAAKVQYVRPEIIGLVLGAFIMSVASKEFKARAGSSPAIRFVLGAFVVIGALAFLGCPLRMVLRLGGGDLNALVGLIGFTGGILLGIASLKKGFSLKRSYEAHKAEGGVLLGGCPLRQLILAAQGNGDSAVTVFGMLVGAALAHNFGLAGNPDSKSEAGELIVGGISTAGKIAVVLGLVVMLVVVILNLPKKEEAKA